VPLDRAGRVPVNADLSVPGHPDIFCAGDLAAATTETGAPVPAVAPAANQMGALVGANIARRVAGTAGASFRYVNKGDLATIGRHKAVAVIAGLRLRGTFAWLTWLFVHILYLVGLRNRLTVVVQWAYQYFTFQRGVRLITGTTVHRLLKASKAAHEKRRAA
jgi:NADH dehydrogenase